MNLACEKHTWQTSEKYPSSKAVDGLCGNLSESGGQCAVSLESNADVTWLVDLANSDLAGTFLGFSVYVSNTTVKEDGYLCYHDTTYTPSTIPSSLTIECTMPGRYVIYFNTREGNLSTKPGYSTKAQINLCEVEVYDVNNGFTRRLLGFSVAVSNTTDYNHGVICYHERKYNKYTIPSTVDFFCSAVGRYVIFYNERRPGISYPEDYSQYAFVDLCEIEVYGCPIPQYGFEQPACTLPCAALCKYGINNGYTAVFLGFSLYISNSTNRLDGILCHHDTNYTRETIPDHVTIDCPYHGQYVIFYNERLPGVTYPSGYSNLAYGDLCEVEVYGGKSVFI
uniref:Uncharacterized protein n=1 Tax=Magallana gigas TaxID=29159 RepID=K1QTX8_MAGGI